MLKYDKIDITEGIDLNKTNKSKKWMFCHYWYYLNKNFSVMDHLLVMVVKKTAYRVYFKDIGKHKAKKLMNKFNLVGKADDIYCND